MRIQGFQKDGKSGRKFIIMGNREGDGLLIGDILFVFSWRCVWLLVWVSSFVFAVGAVLGGWG